MKKFFKSLWLLITTGKWTAAEVVEEEDIPVCPPPKPVTYTVPKDPLIKEMDVSVMKKVTKEDGTEEEVLSNEKRKVVETTKENGDPVILDITDTPVAKHSKFAPGTEPEVKPEPAVEPKANPKTDSIMKDIEEVVKSKQWSPAQSGGFFKNGKPKKNLSARQTYVNYYGPVPKGKVVYHKDGDETNFHPTNLGAIKRGDLLKLSKNGGKKD